MCELCDEDRVTIVEPRDCDGGLACPHGDECGVDLGQLAGERADRSLTATQLVSEADKMAGDCHTNALAATTWGARWHWWTAKRAALTLAWHLSFIDGPAREQSTYTSLDDETPWGYSLNECWQRWLREARGETVPL